jgi:hypothetical protein
LIIPGKTICFAWLSFPSFTSPSSHPKITGYRFHWSSFVPVHD